MPSPSADTKGLRGRGDKGPSRAFDITEAATWGDRTSACQLDKELSYLRKDVE